MIKPGNRLVQIYAVLVAIYILIKGIQLKDYVLIFGAIATIIYDLPLIIYEEKCVKSLKYDYSIKINSNNKLAQILACIFGIYMVIKYYEENKILSLIGLIMLLGDGFLFIFGDKKICNFI